MSAGNCEVVFLGRSSLTAVQEFLACNKKTITVKFQRAHDYYDVLFYLLKISDIHTCLCKIKHIYRCLRIGCRLGLWLSSPGASFTKKDRTISLKMSVRSFLRSAYVGFMKTS